MLVAEARAQDFTCTTNNGTLTITGYQGPGGAVTVPSRINDLPVVRIERGTFFGRNNVTGVTIDDGITSIGHGAFAGCEILTRLTIPRSVTDWEYVLEFGPAFAGCFNLTEIAVDPLNEAYSSVDGVLFNKSQTLLMLYAPGKKGSYTIPSTVTSIGGQAFFECTNLTSVTISHSVINIEDGFAGLGGGFGAFTACTSLTNVTIGNSLTLLGVGTFSECISLTGVILPASVASIGPRAFQGCASLSSITLGKGLTNIGVWAFAPCAKLTDVTIPSSVTTIEFGAFEGCPGLTGLYFEGNAPAISDTGNVFGGVSQPTIYYLPGTTGWGPTFGGRPTAPWLPKADTHPATFGVQNGQFGFTITWASGMSTVVEACTNLCAPLWLPLTTNTLTSGTGYFTDPDWPTYPTRFYRIRSP